MSKAQHTPTPGPWTQGSNYEVVAMDGTNICKVHNDEGQGADNARFISKAPAMLDALRSYLNIAPAFRSKPVGAPGSQARAEQDAHILLEDSARAILSRIGGAE